MKIALAQIDPFIGDFAGNTQKICSFIERAKGEGCSLVVFPEMALLGYPPRDLLDKPSFVQSSLAYWPVIVAASKGIDVIVGVVSENPDAEGKPYHNTALYLRDGSILGQARKRLLPSYDVFDEERYFEPGTDALRVELNGTRIGVTVCEDIWNVADYLPRSLYHCDPICELVQAGVDLVVNISASPFHVGKAAWASQLLKTQAQRSGAGIVYVNQVGGNDELIFHGHSMVWDGRGELVCRASDFEEDLVVFDTETGRGDMREVSTDHPSEVLGALVLGLRDYAKKCKFKGVVLGLSGGVDSALCACIAALALGRENVMGIAMPGPYNAPESLSDARELAERLGISFDVVPIGPLFDSALATLSPVFAGKPRDVTEENLQARLRGLILMGLSNKFGHLLISTGNKSEVSVGYCTLYGDMNGGLALIGDVPKTMVYELARKLNRDYDWIPERILTRAPSAELRPNQTDQDSLPAYEVLDAILAAYVEKRLSAEEIAAQGWDPELVRWVIQRVEFNEYKRWQAPPILRVTSKAFGIGRRNPIAHGFRETGRTG